MSKPIAVITGDVHFTINTLDLATEVVTQAMEAASHLDVPLILNGDTLDGKAIVRGEIANRLVFLIESAPCSVIVTVGNHELINEKGSEHVLNFLRRSCKVIDRPELGSEYGILPYMSNQDELRNALVRFKANGVKTVILHQGVLGADLGHYVQDKTSLPPCEFSDFRVIASHYHKAQDLKCGPLKAGNVGLFSYIGSPYTQSFSEANDGPKGFQVLYDDGSLELIPLDLRKHVIIEENISSIDNLKRHNLNHDDLLWLKVKGPYSELKKFDKRYWGEQILGHANYKLDLIPTGSVKLEIEAKKMTGGEVLDTTIASLDESEDHKAYLRSLWREVVK